MAKRKKDKSNGCLVSLMTLPFFVFMLPFLPIKILLEILRFFLPKGPNNYRTVSIQSDIDHMDGHDFEYWCANLLRKLGYERVEVTRGSGDQGVDIIAVKDGKKYAIQCKRYSKKLGNKPVQEVFAGKTIYGCNVAVVLTNNYFTDGAKEAAKATGVELWDRDTLRRMLTYAEHMEGRK